MNKNQINTVVNEYLKFEKWCENNNLKTELREDLDKYDEQYRIWLERMEKELA